MISDNVIGRNIKFYRENSGFSQENVANFLKVKREMISYYETGAREIPLEILDRLSDLFGVDVAEFLEEDEKNVKENLICAFRTDGIAESDLETIAQFKAIVKNYLKVTKLMQTHE